MEYIFISPNITQIGGAQIYLRNKSKWLTKKGFRVSIISFSKGEVLIEDLKDQKKNIIEELRFPPHYFNLNNREKIIHKVFSSLDISFEDTIIESNTPNLSIWGELLAKIIKGKHIIYYISENIQITIPELNEFVNFKISRGELAGIKKESFRHLININDRNIPCLMAHVKNIPEDVPYPSIDKINPSNFTIASLGRLNKPYLVPVIEEIIGFAKINSDLIFNLILIGGTRDRRKKRALKKLIAGTHNINLYITGFIYPLPTKLIEIPDVFISSAGGCHISAAYKKITIPIDTNDHHAIGILGITTQNIMFRDQVREPKIKVSTLLHEIFIDKKYDSRDIHYQYDIFSPADYSSHLDLINNSTANHVYYNFHMEGGSIIIKKCILKILGNHAIKIQRLKRKIFKFIKI